MKLSLPFLPILLLLCLTPPTSSTTTPPSYETILSHLSSQSSTSPYNRFTFIESLYSSVPRQIRSKFAMDYEIVCDFIRDKLSEIDVSLEEIKNIFEQEFGEFSKEWEFNMVTRTMRAIGINMDDVEKVRQIRERPGDYSINYDTYKAVTYGGRD